MTALRACLAAAFFFLLLVLDLIREARAKRDAERGCGIGRDEDYT